MAQKLGYHVGYLASEAHKSPCPERCCGGWMCTRLHCEQMTSVCHYVPLPFSLFVWSWLWFVGRGSPTEQVDMNERAAFRRVLRLCRQIDRNPAKMSATMGAPPRFYNQFNGRMEIESCSRSPLVKDTMSHIRGGFTQFAHPVGAAALSVRRHKLLAQALGLDYVKESVELCNQLEAAQKMAADIFSTAGCGRENPIPISAKGPTLKRLPAKKSEPVREGDILIAHPMSYVLEDVFDRSVIIITAVEGIGVSGLVLTSPLGTTFRELLGGLPISCNTSAHVELAPMLDMPLFLGGPVIFAPMQGGINWLVTRGDIPGSREILPSVWAGGEIKTVMALAAEDDSKVCFFWGFTGWDTNQLRNELERGMWVHARVTSSVGCQLVGTDEPLTLWKTLLHRAGMHCLAEFPRGGCVDEKLRKLLADFNKQIGNCNFNKNCNAETGCSETE